MAEIETLGILDDIETLVSDNLQVVSYKWLSRNFLVSSDAAKRLLQEFVEKKGSKFEVVYTLSGWLMNNPSVYHIRLVSRSKLGVYNILRDFDVVFQRVSSITIWVYEAKQDFDENCSVQVYSVQSCIPKDSASLWNAEFVQAEELFKQSPTVNNCLRDNRFCGVSNSYVKRNVEGIHGDSTTVLNSSSTVPGPSISDSAYKTAPVPQPQQRNDEQLSHRSVQQSLNEVKNLKSGTHGTGVQEQASKSGTERAKITQFTSEKKDQQNSKVSSGTGGSLVTMWGRVSANTKPIGAPSENPNTAVNTAAKVSICKAVDKETSEDDDHDINIKRTSNGDGSRKRRVFFDFSDDEDESSDVISLASPDPPKQKSTSNSNQSSKVSLLDNASSMNIDKHKGNKREVKEENNIKMESDNLSRKGPVAGSKSNKNGMPTLDKAISCKPEINGKDKVTGAALNLSTVDDKGNNSGTANHTENPIEEAAPAKDKVISATPSSNKKRRVLKTRIDERGREVTEVVWEGDELETKANSNATIKTSNNGSSTEIRAPAPKKSPAVGNVAPSNPVSKAGNKKGGKDTKQGNILSFFKKV